MSGKLSWIVAILLIIGFVVFLGMKIFMPVPDSPTAATAKPGALDPIGTELSVSEIAPVSLDNSNSAGTSYAEAVEFFRNNAKDFKETYKTFSESEATSQLFGWQLELSESLHDKIKPARNCGKMNYVFVHTPQNIEVSGVVPGQDDLYWLKNVLECLCMHYQQEKNWEKAKDAAEDMLILGWQMANDDSRGNMQITGLGIQAEAAQRLAWYYKELNNQSMATKCDTYYRQALTAKAKADEKYGNIWTLRNRSGGKQGPGTGDLLNILENDPSRAWKVEALLAMCITKIQEKGHTGNTNAIKAAYAKYSKSDDKLISEAAKASQKATKDELEKSLRGN